METSFLIQIPMEKSPKYFRPTNLFSLTQAIKLVVGKSVI